MKILNLYAGIGGNRQRWAGHEVTAVEYSPEIAEFYSSAYPDDKVIIGDAHQFLLENYKDYDFIWSSPPCPTHSKVRKMGVRAGQYPALYPDLSIWQEIVLLDHFADCPWVVENVSMYYKPIIEPTFKIDRHWFWASEYVSAPERHDMRDIPHMSILKGSTIYGVCLQGSKIPNKRQAMRNMVNPHIGDHIFKSLTGAAAPYRKQMTLL